MTEKWHRGLKLNFSWSYRAIAHLHGLYHPYRRSEDIRVFSLSEIALVIYTIRTKVDKLNVKTETWTAMPPLKEGRLNHDCAFHRSTDASKSYVVVAGGQVFFG